MSPRPTVGSFAEELYRQLSPIAYEDERLGWPMLVFLEAIGRMFQEVEDYARDDDGRPGWSSIMDADRAPAKALGWLGQFAGVRLRPGLTEEAQRLRVKSTDGFKRGSPGAVKAAAQQHLIGNKTVFLTERHGSAYKLTVTTYSSETPDVIKVFEALKEQKPAGIVITHSVVPGGDFNTLRDTHSDFNDVTTTFVDFNEIRANPAKQ